MRCVLNRDRCFKEKLQKPSLLCKSAFVRGYSISCIAVVTKRAGHGEGDSPRHVILMAKPEDLPAAAGKARTLKVFSAAPVLGLKPQAIQTKPPPGAARDGKRI
jgi:hypothetical protein